MLQSSHAGNERPLVIGITTRHGAEEWVQRNTRNYVNMVRELGGEPVILSPDHPAHLPGGATYTPDAAGRLDPAVLAELDGIIFSGGGDVHPRYFGQPLAGAEESTIDEKRDELEIHLAQAALALDLPIFGICRGCQVLNVAAGGGMVQHLDGHRSPADGPTSFHTVELSPASKFGAIVGQPSLPVNTFHHQGLDQASLAPIFAPVARAAEDEWLVEAYESPRHRWVIGVQWHPERHFELEHGHRRIWESFVAACAARRKGGEVGS